MPNPNPSPDTRFQPLGETNLVFRRFAIRPDQAARLALEANQAAAVRAALDTYFIIHAPPNDDTDYGAAACCVIQRKACYTEVALSKAHGPKAGILPAISPVEFSEKGAANGE